MPADGFATDHVYIGAELMDLAAGPDGAVWFTWRTNTGKAQIVRLRVVAPPPPPPPPPPAPPTPLTPAVAPTPVATPVVVTPSLTG